MAKSLLEELYDKELAGLQASILLLRDDYAAHQQLAERAAKLSGSSVDEVISAAQSIAFHHASIDWKQALNLICTYHLAVKRLEKEKQETK